MASATPSLPCFDLTTSALLEPGSVQWKQLSRSVRDAMETHGGLLIKSDHTPDKLHDQMFQAMGDLFRLPLDTKNKITTIYPQYPYHSGPKFDLHHYESVRVGNPTIRKETDAFTNILFPEGNNTFSELVSSMSTKILGLTHIIMKLVLDSYGLEGHREQLFACSETHLNMTKYSAPMTDEPQLGLSIHADGTFITIICANSEDGLVFKSREGEWFEVKQDTGSFAVFVGQAFRAWSNGRLYAPPHKVMISGAEDRFSCGLFLRPKMDEVIEAPFELVDEDHPRLFKAFAYKDFVKFSSSNRFQYDSLETFAGALH